MLGNIVFESTPDLSGYVPYTGATNDVDLGTHLLNGAGVNLKGTAGTGHLGMKHQSANATAGGQETVLFADSNGDIKWKIDGNYFSTLKTSSNTADRIYTFPNNTGTVALTSDLTGYVVAAGKAGGQNIYGGTAAGENLKLYSTNNATKGKIYITDSFYTEVAPTSGIDRIVIPGYNGGGDSSNIINYPFIFTQTGGSRANYFYANNGNATFSLYQNANNTYLGNPLGNDYIQFAGTINLGNSNSTIKQANANTISNGKAVIGMIESQDNTRGMLGVGVVQSGRFDNVTQIQQYAYHSGFTSFYEARDNSNVGRIKSFTDGSSVYGASAINTASMMQLDSTTKGFLPPRLTTTQKNNIATPPAGLMIYDNTLNKVCVYTGAAWETITSV